MKIDNINIENFRQYFGSNYIDLITNNEKNIILIGGKNGYGKTNFLMSLVWCLYGEDISKIDEGFRKEIQKEGNYSKYLKASLNWDALKNGEESFVVSLKISDIDLPETMHINPNEKYICQLTRSFNYASGNEDFTIDINGVDANLFNDSDYKKIFVNDYLIPVEAAKFVFFDAEKIASWAELSTKEEGSVLNDALGKILGLDIYEGLIDDLEIYSDALRKESATSSVRQQITTTEKGIELNSEKIIDYDAEILQKENAVSELRAKVKMYEGFILKNGSQVLDSQSLEKLYTDKKALEAKEKDLESKFNELTELIPLAISSGKMEEVDDHLKKQEADLSFNERQFEFYEKNNLMLERLFNSPPFPTDGDITFSKKIFYADKAKSILEEIYGEENENEELRFEHDLNRSDTDLVHQTINYIRKQTKDIFEVTIDGFDKIKNEIFDIDRLIRKIESDQQDEEIIRYTNGKNESERKIDKLIEEKGALQSQISQLKRSIESDNQRLQILIKKIEVSEQKRKKLDKASLYMKSLKEFVDEQKKRKCQTLEHEIFSEMEKLMHKLSSKKGSNFIAGVRAEPLPDNDGLKITLLDNEGQIRQKETLSQGEKQIYISSLIKAILSLSIQEFPIFIDTPLGRLDHEHIEKILLNYYPDLASQVVLMATNNEIPPSRFKLMSNHVAQTYLLENINNKTTFKQGYFQGYEN